ncbi:MAG: hypothetical protein A2Z24_00365 [Candidatus Woykebacteria bacterium RBG_16_44_10]|uniref:Uncharacterized protein n=1 Tax=Candidatus Woykebacteria bacterium RBG_16_44_10 TaxID=1802597 RepID=A0A1G1WFG5_9BACT|nr:MAG: hypothetical protein A2Z24_00365 [Candidatus Woykebacteria bacterium RBG_16_44_10]
MQNKSPRYSLSVIGAESWMMLKFFINLLRKYKGKGESFPIIAFVYLNVLRRWLAGMQLQERHRSSLQRTQKLLTVVASKRAYWEFIP